MSNNLEGRELLRHSNHLVLYIGFTFTISFAHVGDKLRQAIYCLSVGEQLEQEELYGLLGDVSAVVHYVPRKQCIAFLQHRRDALF